MTPPRPPHLIVSLMPGITELLCLLGLADQLVPVSHECDFPPAIQTLPRVTRSLLVPDLSSQQIDQAVREQPAAAGSTLGSPPPAVARARPHPHPVPV